MSFLLDKKGPKNQGRHHRTHRTKRALPRHVGRGPRTQPGGGREEARRGDEGYLRREIFREFIIFVNCAKQTVDLRSYFQRKYILAQQELSLQKIFLGIISLTGLHNIWSHTTSENHSIKL